MTHNIYKSEMIDTVRTKDNPLKLYLSPTHTDKTSEKVDRYLCEKRNLNTLYKTNTIWSILFNNNNTIKIGVYKLPCRSRREVYVGQTGRNSQKRIQEHYRSFVNKKQDSAHSVNLIQIEHNNIKNNIEWTNQQKSIHLFEEMFFTTTYDLIVTIKTPRYCTPI